MLADYLAATRNEIAVDEMLLSVAKFSPEQIGYVPRVPLWLNEAKRAPVVARLLARLACGVWLCGGALAYFALDLFKLFVLWGRGAGTAAQTPSRSNGAVLGFSSRVCDVLDPASFHWLPKVWLTCPWAAQHTLPKEALELPMLSLIGKGDFWQAFLFATRASYVLAQRPLQAGWALQSYTAARWFLVRKAVDKISGDMITVEHFDRWAVLADRSVRAQRRSDTLPRRLVLVQHGALGGLGGQGQGHATLQPMPTRLRCVSELHAYNAQEAAVFRRVVLATPSYATNLRVGYFKPSITLRGESQSRHPRLLFVGHPLCEPFQQALYLALSKAVAFEAYYKPHPKAPMSAAMASVGWTVINEPGHFPRVELLVSYPSTLVIEYEAASIRACVHPLNVTMQDLPQYLEQVVRHIQPSSAMTSSALPEPAHS